MAKGYKVVQEEIQGQGQMVTVNEVYYQADEFILDPEAANAVQIPAGVGADTATGISTALGDALAEGNS